MIVKLTEDNIKAYKDLFESASAELNDGTIINDIEGYFQRLGDLMNISLKYTMLPADEERFEIDANTRSIKIPSNFSKHGIGVQGDDVAEIVWFEIDRYYDIVDFYNTRPVVQWKHSGNSESYISDAWFKDIDTVPGKLIFGWPVDKNICEISGDLEFSVRFIGFDGDSDNINYSFNTLPIKVKVNKSLNISEIRNIIDDSINEKIKSRIKNSIDGNASLPLPPIFITAANSGYIDVINNEMFLSVDSKNPSTNKIVNIGNRGSKLLLRTGAVSTTNIVYNWKRKGASEDVGIDSKEISEAQKIYLPTKRENNKYKINGIDKNLICYFDNDCTQEINFEDKDNYQDKVKEILDDSDNSLGHFIEAYVQPQDFSVCEIEGPGTYWVIAKNDIQEADNYLQLCSSKSRKIEVPEPEALEFTGYSKDNVAIEYIEIPKNDTSYSIKGNFVEPNLKDVDYVWSYEESLGTGKSIVDSDDGVLTINKNSKTGYYSINATNYYNNGAAEMTIPENKEINLFASKEPVINFTFDADFKANKKAYFTIDIGTEKELNPAVYGSTLEYIVSERVDLTSSAIEKKRMSLDLSKLNNNEISYNNGALVITIVFDNIFSEVATDAIVKINFKSKANSYYALETSKNLI